MNENKRCVLDIDQLNCASCVEKIEKRLSTLNGIVKSSVNFASGKATIEYMPQQIDEPQIIQAIADLGYPAHPHRGIPVHEHKERAFKILLIQTILAFLLSTPLILHMMGISIPLKLQIGLATVVQFGCGYFFYYGTWQGLKQFSANMDTLVALGTTAAYGYSLYSALTPQPHHLYFETSALLISFILLGKVLEMKAKRKAGARMESLMKLQPLTAHVMIHEQVKEVPIEEVKRDTLFLVLPGERVPFDGVVTQGQSHLDESMLTGESFPVEKKEGGQIFAGTLNQEGLLKARATHVGSDTTLGQIIHMVEQAQASKAPIQRVADRVTAGFVPFVLLVALLTFLAWWGIALNPFEGFINAIAVLVIACPCALGLATPTVIMVACDKASREGILIKDAEVLEWAQNIKTLFLDKTGTVTEGGLSVIQEEYSLTCNKEDFLSLSLGLSRYSDHPAARAIVSYLSRANVQPREMTEFTAFPGKGVGGKYNSQRYYLGSISFLEGMKVDSSEFMARWNQETAMIVALSDEMRCWGYFLLTDQVKPEAKEAVAKLHQWGIQVILLTGDRMAIASRVSREIGADSFEAEILPEHKAQRVEQLKKKGEMTAMVGDGINDAPALAKADIGIAIGAGADVALESASVILVKSDLIGVAKTVLLAKKTFKKIRQNLVFAFGYNCLCIPIAALGMLNPLIAGIAMALSSVSVVFNALSLARESID